MWMLGCGRETSSKSGLEDGEDVLFLLSAWPAMLVVFPSIDFCLEIRYEISVDLLRESNTHGLDDPYVY